MEREERVERDREFRIQRGLVMIACWSRFSVFPFWLQADMLGFSSIGVMTLKIHVAGRF